jgi:hypothetical protein
VCYSDCMTNRSFHESEVAFGLTTLLRIKGLAHAVGSVAVEPVLGAGARAYHVTATARSRGALGEILTRLLDRPFRLDQLGWVISRTEVSTVLTAGGF